MDLHRALRTARCFSSWGERMEEIRCLTVTEGGGRVDKYVAQQVPSVSRSRIKQLIEDGFLQVNGSVVKPSHRLEDGDEVVLRIPAVEEVQLAPEHVPLRIVYEDEDLVVVDKPAGLVVHPAPGHERGTLANALVARYPDLPLDEDGRPGIVHRLDKDTSGLILVAKNEAARRDFQGQFKRGEVDKVYLALVHGKVEPVDGIIDAPLGRDVRNRKRMAVARSGGRQAVTQYHVLEHLGDFTLLEVRPHTGRTHQVRVHLAFIRHPVVGDETYGRRKQRLGVKRQFLHAHRLGFRLPGSGASLELVSELPDDLAVILRRLREPNLVTAQDWEGLGSGD
jgi:23S rRNA pseudouridine1911/1915/1917 synthase